MYEIDLANPNRCIVRDCAYENVLMDGASLFPHGFHPLLSYSAPHNIRELAWYYPRYTVPKPVKYYFIDFGISVHFSPGQQPKLVTGMKGLDRDPPELSDTVPYDPFKLDVFILGNLFKTTIYQVCVLIDTADRSHVIFVLSIMATLVSLVH